MENSDKQHVAAVQNIYKKIAAARKNPLSEHNMAMSKLDQLDTKRPAAQGRQSAGRRSTG